MSEKIESLAEALPRVMTHVRDNVMPAYIEIGPPGKLALMVMRAELDAAQKAIMEGDTVEMLRLYESLKEFHV